MPGAPDDSVVDEYDLKGYLSASLSQSHAAVQDVEFDTERF